MIAFTHNSIRVQGFSKFRDLLRLIAALRGIQEPLDTVEGLRKALEILVQLASLLGVDPQLLEKLRTILADERVFQVVLSVVQYLSGLLKSPTESSDGRLRFAASDGSHSVVIEAQDFFDWLPIILEILDLIRKLLGQE